MARRLQPPQAFVLIDKMLRYLAVVKEAAG